MILILFIMETMFEGAPSSTLSDPHVPVALRDHIWNDITGSLDFTLCAMYTMHLNVISYTLCVFGSGWGTTFCIPNIQNVQDLPVF